MNCATALTTNIQRAVLRYHGGKFKAAPWIISHFPDHEIFVDCFGGGGSVTMRKAPSKAEVYNDLNNEVVNVFRVLRNPRHAKRLKKLLHLTPFARTEYEQSYNEPGDDPVENARLYIVRCFFAHGTSGNRLHQSGFRSKVYTHNATGAGDWVNYPSHVEAFTSRLKGVVIENRDALDLIRQHDSDSTLFYCDPPYPLSTRTSMQGHSWSGNRAYKHDMTDEHHRRLAETLHVIKGMAIVSGYACDLYDKELYPDWKTDTRQVYADGGKKRTEKIWMNPACSQAMVQKSLF